MFLCCPFKIQPSKNQTSTADEKANVQCKVWSTDTGTDIIAHEHSIASLSDAVPKQVHKILSTNYYHRSLLAITTSQGKVAKPELVISALKFPFQG